MTDTNLPTLDLALDARQMQGILAEACLPEGDRFEIRACRVAHVRHKPGRTCLIGYELLLFDRQRGAEVRQWLSGRVYPADASESRWRKAQGADLVPARAGRALTHLADQSMVVWAFPNERKLRGIAQLLDPQSVRAALGRFLGHPVAEVGVELVRYIPEHGCTVRVHADGRVFYAKVYADDRGEATWHNMLALWRHPRQNVVLAKPIAYDAPARTLWQECAGARAEVDLATCARALAEFHAIPLEGLPPAPDAGEEVRVGQGKLGAFGFDIAELADEIVRRLPQPTVTGTLHGDLHAQNFLVADGAAALIDLDTLAAGDPRRDIGSLLASLPSNEGLAPFLAAYGGAWTVRDVATYTALALVVERATRAISRRKAEPGTEVPRILERASSLLAATATARDVMNGFAARAAALPGEKRDVHYRTYRKAKSWHKSSATVAYEVEGTIHVRRFGAESTCWVVPHDPALPQLTTILDPEAVKHLLPIPADRVEIDVLNYRPESRCTLRFRIESDGARRTIYGKTYCDDRGARVSERLAALWQMHSRDFPVPLPLGYSSGIRTAWQMAFEGGCLADRLDRAGSAELLRLAGRRLAFLHRSRIACPQRACLTEQWNETSKKVAKLATVVPHLESRLSALMHKLDDRRQQWAPSDAGVVHGDFHVRQLMVSGAEVALFDFDEIGWGDPLEDFGHFAADLAASGRDPQPFLREVIAGYGHAVPPAGLAWHTALQLATRAYRGLLQLRPDLDARAERLLQLAEECFV